MSDWGGGGESDFETKVLGNKAIITCKSHAISLSQFS